MNVADDIWEVRCSGTITLASVTTACLGAVSGCSLIQRADVQGHDSAYPHRWHGEMSD